MTNAQLLLMAADEHRSISARPIPAIDAAQAEQISTQIIEARQARGEQPAGYKIGFTNRSIWPLYGVDRPLWGAMYNTTIEQLDANQFSLNTSQFIEPRLEPEIVFGLKATPLSSSTADLVAAIGWFAHGFEIVQSVYPAWKFSAAEAFAAQGLHGALKIGARMPLSKLSDPIRELAQLRVTLQLQGKPIAIGVGANVLDGPVQALAYLARELERRNRKLRPGDIVTTGTLTDAAPITAGQQWSTRFEPGESFTVAPPGLQLTAV